MTGELDLHADLVRKLGWEVRDQRARRGITQMGLGIRARRGTTWAWSIETGRRRIRQRDLDDLERAFELAPGELLRLAEQRSGPSRWVLRDDSYLPPVRIPETIAPAPSRARSGSLSRRLPPRGRRPTLAEAIGLVIAEERVARGLTQSQLGALLGMSQRSVYMWESGAYVPRLRALERLAAGFEMDMERLLERAREVYDGR